MDKIKNIGIILSVIGGLLIGCEEAEDDPAILPTLPLAGTYTLTEMTINMDATLLRDTVLVFITPQNGVDTVFISAGETILSTTTLYTDNDATPIGGTVVLENDSSATLHGLLPVNWGTGCAPNVLISDLGSGGTWAADTTTGLFELDLVVDALDIDGYIVITDDLIEVHYEALVSNDERMITSVSYMGSEVPVNPACVAVSTVTERILTLIPTPEG